MTFTTIGRGVALVAAYGPGRGKAKIYVDGRFRATIDLGSTTARLRAVAWQVKWPRSGLHTIKVVVVGTAGRPRVDIDGVIVVK
jgi:hypothetical protein